jgi:hypothetical protein
MKAMAKRKFHTVFDRFLENVKRREAKKERNETLMMFEFEKIDLIDGRWKEEIDQIRF